MAAVAVALLLSGCHKTPKADYATAKWFSRLPPDGYTPAREGRKIDLIILYTTEHAAERIRKLWCESPAVSGHYIVTENGEVWQCLKDSDGGWHAGNRDYNLRSIAVAVEGYADPGNPENLTKTTPWPTEQQLVAVANLMKWLCEQYAIPVDRAHIIGKNQFPGVKTEQYPESRPQYWGGASNKSAPGTNWNWCRLMEKLGRRPDYHSLIVMSNCVVTTMPAANSPVITPVMAGKELTAYDNCNGYWLVLMKDQSVAQPYLPVGRYHWDGWVDARCVTVLSGTNYGTNEQ